MEGLNCKIIDLTYQNEEQFEELLKISDMLYIGGGLSDDLIAYFKEKKFDEMLEITARAYSEICGKTI